MIAGAPPANSTFPFGRRVAVCPNRAVVILPALVKVPVAGLNNIALASAVAAGSSPPAMSTLPSFKSVLVGPL